MSIPDAFELLKEDQLATERTREILTSVNDLTKLTFGDAEKYAKACILRENARENIMKLEKSVHKANVLIHHLKKKILKLGDESLLAEIDEAISAQYERLLEAIKDDE